MIDLSLFEKINTPAYVVDEERIIKNLEILKEVKEQCGCRILLAQKAFSMFSLYPLIEKYLDGTTASGLYEARLGREEFNGEVHVFSPAFRDDEFDEIASVSDHIVFNSPSEVFRYHERCKGKNIGLRVNPECSTQSSPIYDPCSKGSRLGTTLLAFDEKVLKLINGLHFHTLCEQGADALAITLKAFEEKFGKYLRDLDWVNFGGGHHITRDDYDRELLIRLVSDFRERYGVEVYLEPGEAVALNAGYLVTRVLDIVHNDIDIAILDTSAACHMPDVLEMPYRPPLFNSALPHEKKYDYRLSSATCLAGDVIGDYSFDAPLKRGETLIFLDMAIYSMVKNNTFNGMRLPDIGILDRNGKYKVIKSFGYEDFKERLS